MRYIIGIDLGTTNSCVSFVDSEQSNSAIQPFKIPQLSAAGHIEHKSTLPSFCYLAEDHEWPKGSLDLPWKKSPAYFVGHMALHQGAKVPTRLVRSAKSWLCHSAANRREKILPLESSSEAKRISPVEATTKYLEHIKSSWNHLIANDSPGSTFSEQDIVLTVPASFDEVARALTVEAAKQAGYQNLTLLEEPQAAFYSWLSYNEQKWEKHLSAGNVILVCDVGGGTTDFSLIEVIEKNGKLTLQRMAVGDHLLLGGDNMDAAIALLIQGKLQLNHPTMTQWLQLCHEARAAKEALLSHGAHETYKILLQGTGSGVIKGSLSTEISRQEIEECLLKGFFGQYEWDEAIQLKKAGGLRTMGLPYEDEAAITKHLARFLSLHKGKPDYILFNGGTMKAPSFQQAIISSLKRWFPDKPLQVLPSANLDLAVGRGAAYYGKVRRGLGVKIGGGTARGYYLAIQNKTSSTNDKALTLLPRGCEEGSSYIPKETFWLTPNTPVSFQIYTSHVRLHDQSGEVIDIDTAEMHSLPPIHTILKYGKQGENLEKIPVNISIHLTAIGTLEMWVKSEKTTHQWSLEFQVRSSSGQENSIALTEKRALDKNLDQAQIEEAQNLIKNAFSGSNKQALSQLSEQLENILGAEKKRVVHRHIKKDSRHHPPSIIKSKEVIGI